MKRSAADQFAARQRLGECDDALLYDLAANHLLPVPRPPLPHSHDLVWVLCRDLSCHDTPACPARRWSARAREIVHLRGVALPSLIRHPKS